MSDKIEVTEADREAASSVMFGGSRAMLEGRADSDLVVQAFARHRQAAMLEGARLLKAKAVRRLELRQGLYGGEPMTTNESNIARSMLEAVSEIDEAQIVGGEG